MAPDEAPAVVERSVPSDYPDMTTADEREWTRRQMRSRPHGAVVELGPWFGGITQAIVSELEEEQVVHVYDWFRFAAGEGGRAGTAEDHDGDSYRSTFEERIGPDGMRHVVVHEGDLQEFGWDDGPIGFLYIDAAKDRNAWGHIKRTWLAAVPVGGIVVQQDWAHAWTHWLHAWHYMWHDHFDVIGHVPFAGTVGFRLTRPLPPEAFTSHDAGPAEAFDWAGSLVDDTMRPNLEGARVFAALETDNMPTILRSLAQAIAGCPSTGELSNMAAPAINRYLDRIGAR